MRYDHKDMGVEWVGSYIWAAVMVHVHMLSLQSEAEVGLGVPTWEAFYWSS